MIWAIITAAAFVLCAAKYITARAGNWGVDKAFLKLHTVGGALLPVGAGVYTAKLGRKKAGLGSMVSWLCVDVGVGGLMFSHFFGKKLGKRAMPLHRFFTVFTLVALAVHFIHLALKRK